MLAASADHERALTLLHSTLDQLKVKNPGAAVLLAKSTPLTGPLNAEVNLYNAQLDTVAAARRAIGQDVWTVDHNASFPVATLLDGIHPNWIGDDDVAWRWRLALDAAGC